MGVLDVVHHDNEGGAEVCTSTITYMFDGTVGLLADLALVAQAAALAREVSATNSVAMRQLILFSKNREIGHFWLTIRIGIAESMWQFLRSPS